MSRRSLPLLFAGLLALAGPPVAAPAQDETVLPPVTRQEPEIERREGLLPVTVEVGEKGGRRDLTTTIEIVLLLSFLTLLPSLLLTLTCFTRVVIVLSFVRRAMATPEVPPNPVLIGLALFITMAVMQPVATGIYDRAARPYLDGELSFAEAGTVASSELKSFLIRFTREDDVALFMEVLGSEPVEGPQALPLRIAIPAFVLSELKTAFTMGFVIYLPFLVVDLVIASILLSMGMFMLPPMLIATPIKVLLFVLVDGWGIVISQLWTSLTAVG